MSPLVLAATLAAIFFFGAVLRSAVGFGDALVAMPLLTLMVGLQTAAPLFAAVALAASLTILAGSWRDVHFREALPLIAGSALGVPLGIVLLRLAPEAALKTALGVALVVFGLVRPLLPDVRLRHGGLVGAGLAGWIAGVLGGAYNINGPPVVIYGTLRGWTPARFRATLQGFFLATGGMIVIGHLVGGLWTRRVVLYALLCLPAMLTGVVVGARIHRRIRPERFELWIAVLLVAIGVGLLLDTWRG